MRSRLGRNGASLRDITPNRTHPAEALTATVQHGKLRIVIGAHTDRVTNRSLRSDCVTFVTKLTSSCVVMGHIPALYNVKWTDGAEPTLASSCPARSPQAGEGCVRVWVSGAVAPGAHRVSSVPPPRRMSSLRGQGPPPCPRRVHALHPAPSIPHTTPIGRAALSRPQKPSFDVVGQSCDRPFTNKEGCACQKAPSGDTYGIRMKVCIPEHRGYGTEPAQGTARTRGSCGLTHL